MALFDEVEYLDELTKPIFDLMEQANMDALGVISKRINKIGKLTPTDANKLSVLYRRADIVEIEKILADATKLSLKQLDALIEESATNNDALAKELYDAKNTVQKGLMENAALQSIVKSARANMVDGILNLSKTKAFMFDGKMTSIAKTYNDAVNLAIYNVQSGLVDYNSAMRSTIMKMSDSGIRTVDFESGYSRRLDSSVRMNVLDGVRQMNMAYREQQGEEYGADMVFVSFHSLCAVDHQPINGMEYTKARWLNIAESLKRQVGQRNCKHYITYGVKGISENPISDKQQSDAIKNSNSTVKYKDLNGNEIETSKYEFSQRQRVVETNIRKLKDRKNQFEMSGDNVQVQELNSRIKDMTKYYKSMSEQGGLTPKLDRLRVYNENKLTNKKILPVENMKIEKEYPLINGVKKSTPMSFEDANNMKVNPNFNKGNAYMINCQSCVPTFEARRRGYDVQTLPNTKNSSLEKLSHDIRKAWIDKETGKHPEYITFGKNDARKYKEFLNETINKDERYQFSFEWAGRRSAHTISIDRNEDGILRLYDPQIGKSYLDIDKPTGKIYSEDEKNKLIKIAGKAKAEKIIERSVYENEVIDYLNRIKISDKDKQARIFRIDDKEFNYEVINEIMKGY